MTPRDVIPVGWTQYLRAGSLTWGLDLATTEKAKSNPSSLVVTEKWGGLFIERLVLAWKTADEQVTLKILELMFDDVAATSRKFRSGAIDATNETFFAQTVKKTFRNFCAIYLVKGGEKLEHRGQEFDAKTLLGSLFVNAHTDNKIATPGASWIKDDRRLVKRNKGKFEADLGKEGQHGDTFDGGKLALYCQLKAGGRAEADAAAVSEGISTPQSATRKLLNPFAHLHESGSSKINF